jgi:hypothetical protein
MLMVPPIYLSGTIGGRHALDRVLENHGNEHHPAPSPAENRVNSLTEQPQTPPPFEKFRIREANIVRNPLRNSPFENARAGFKDSTSPRSSNGRET